MGQTQESGNLGERIAARYLEGCGYTVVARNYREKIGEIDLIVKDCSTWVFVEVKTRSNSSFGSPLDAITAKKLMSIIRTSQLFLQKMRLGYGDVRYDAVEVIFSPNTAPEINHVKNITM